MNFQNKRVLSGVDLRRMENKQQDFGKGEGKTSDYRIDSPKITLVKSNSSSSQFDSFKYYQNHNYGMDKSNNNFEKLLEIEKEKNRILLLEKQVWEMKENLLNKVLFEKHSESLLSSMQGLLSNTQSSIVRVAGIQENSNNSIPKLDSNLVRKLSSFPINEDSTGSSSSLKHASSSSSIISPLSSQSLSSKNSSIRISTLDEVSEISTSLDTIRSSSEELSEIKLDSSRSQILDRNAIPIPPPKPVELTLQKSSKNSLVLLDKRQYLYKQFLCSLKEYQLLLQIFLENYVKVIENVSDEVSLKRHVAFDHVKVISEQNAKVISELSALLSRNGIILVGEEQFFIQLVHQLFELTQSNYISYFDQYFSIIQVFKSEKRKSSELKQAIRKVEKELVERKTIFWKFESFLSIPNQFVEKISALCEKVLKSSDKFYIGLENYAKLGQSVIILRDLNKYSKSKLEVSNDLGQLLDISKNLALDGLVTHKRKVIHSYFMAERIRDCGNITPCQLFLFHDMFLIKYPRKYRWFKMKVLKFHLDEINRHGLPMHSIRSESPKSSELVFIRGDFECKQTKLCIRFKNEEEAIQWKDDILNCIEKECLQLC